MDRTIWIVILFFLAFALMMCLGGRALGAEKVILTESQTRCPSGYNKTIVPKICCPTGSYVQFESDECCPKGYRYMHDGQCHKCPDGMTIFWPGICCPNNMILMLIDDKEVCGN